MKAAMLASWIIFVLEMSAAYRIIGTRSKDHDVEEFLTNATPDDFYKMYCHVNMGWFMMQLATILSIM
jgi:hypothetical protein